MKTSLYANMTLLLSISPKGRKSRRWVQSSELHPTIAKLTKQGYTGFRAL